MASPRRWNISFSCVRRGAAPRENGHDGRAVVEAVHALYASAASGRRIEFPFHSEAVRPIDHWKPTEQTSPGVRT